MNKVADHVRRGVVGAIAAVCLTAFSVEADAADVMKFRFAMADSLNTPFGHSLQTMANEVKKRSNGTMEVEIFAGGQLGGEVEILTQLRSGNIDGAFLGVAPVSSLEPSVGVADLPYMWKSPEMFWKTLNGPIGEELLNKLTTKGIKGMAWGAIGPRGWLSNGYTISKPEDMKGRKVRVIQSPFYVKMIEAFGGNPTPIAFPELYVALQSKAIDTVDAAYLAFDSAKLYEVATSLTVSNHLYSALVAVMNGVKFSSLTPEQQKIFVESSRAGCEAGYNMVNTASDQSIEKMRARGLTVSKLAPDAFASRVQPVYDYFASQVGSMDLINRVKAAQN